MSKCFRIRIETVYTFCGVYWPKKKGYFLRWLFMNYILCFLAKYTKELKTAFFCMLYFLPFPDSRKACAFTVRIIGKSPSSSTANSLNCFKTQPWNLAKLSSYQDVKSCTPMSLSLTLFLQLTHPEQDDVRPGHNLLFLDSFYVLSSLSSQPNY